jgi:hypothetical protein
MDSHLTLSDKFDFVHVGQQNPYLPQNKTLLNFTYNEKLELHGNISLTGQNMLYFG